MSLGQTHSLVFNLGSEDPALILSANCYTPESSDPHGLILLCLHGAGTLGAYSRAGFPHSQLNAGFSIREACAVDWQSHGAETLINEAALKNRPGVSVLEWAAAIASLIESPHLRGHRIVAVGHSAGASVVVLTTRNFLVSSVPFIGMVIVEPVMCSEDFYREYGEERESALSTTIMVVNSRRTTWPSRDEAFKYMRKNFIWKGWDPRVLRTYVDYGMHDLPTNGGIAISTNNEQEIGTYMNVPPHLAAVDGYRRIAPFVSVHFIFGARNHL
ncbi:hypothetical protein B0H11DRAFT_2215430 [Mycena galericulata]|nr:hypothetical protein B0H11DRAFT_2215430 [Mycena galericulata]